MCEWEQQPPPRRRRMLIRICELNRWNHFHFSCVTSPTHTHTHSPTQSHTHTQRISLLAFRQRRRQAPETPAPRFLFVNTKTRDTHTSPRNEVQRGNEKILRRCYRRLIPAHCTGPAPSTNKEFRQKRLQDVEYNTHSSPSGQMPVVSSYLVQ